MATFEKTKGFANMTGEWYEVKLSALLFLRALQTGQKFQLASNMKAAGSFDDVVLTLGDHTLFLQLKHREKSDIDLKFRELTCGKNFNLSKYLNSYLDIKKRWQSDPDLQRCGRFEDAKFIIYTNVRVDENLVGTFESTDLLTIVSTGGTCVRLNELFKSLPKYKVTLSAAVSTDYVTGTPELWEIVHKIYNKQAQTLPSKKQLQEMLVNLESLGDLNCYQQFISQLYFCSGQTAEKDVDDHIRLEIHSDTMLEKLLSEIQNWWRISNSYLTEKSQCWLDILNTCSANVFKQSLPINIKFRKEHCDTMKEKLRSGSRLLYVCTQCISISTIKILQSFETNLLIDVNTLQTHLNDVLAVWRLGTCNTLVVEGKTAETNILQKLAMMPDFKYVVVISETECAQLYQQFKFVLFHDTFCLSQLESDSQREILESEIMFQGFPLKLNSLADVSFLESVVTAEVVVQLHYILNVGEKLDNLNSCYIPRVFLRREYVSEQIFGEENVTLAVTGISEERLGRLVQRSDKCCKYFYINNEEEFTNLCESNKNVHWIQACGRGFLWKKSKGDLSLIIKHLEQKRISYPDAQEIITLSHQMELIVAEPGMGKSTEIRSIAQKIKQKDRSTWVIVVDLNQHIKLLSQNILNALEFLEVVAKLNTTFQKSLFEYQLKHHGNVIIFLDGFDEISPHYSEKVFWLLKEFSATRINKIFVTSRPVFLEELQHKLSTLPFSFRGFTPLDQENFLEKCWNQTCKPHFKLTNFIYSLLQVMGTSLNDKLKELTGIPLQCKMLADVFQDEASHYCQTGEVRLPQNFDVLQLYDKFFDKKWEVYCKKMYGDMMNAMLQLHIENQKIQFQKCLMNSAMFSYFDLNFIRHLKSSYNILKQNEVFVKEFNNSQDKTGIVVNIKDDRAVFIHRTFTEYFVAKWYSNNFLLEMNSVKIVYFDKTFEVVKKFLDRMLAQQFKFHTTVLNKDLTNVKHLLSKQNTDVNEKDSGGRTALHLAIMNYCYDKDTVNDYIIEALLEHGADVNCEDKVFRWRPLRLAEEIGVWSVVEKLLEKGADNRDMIWVRTNIEEQNPVVVTRQQVASVQGFVHSVISVFSCGICDSSHYDLDNSDSEFVSHVQYHMSDTLQEVMYTAIREGYVHLVDTVLKCGVSVRHYIIDRSRSGVCKTSMLHIAARQGQLKLVQFLIEQGADVNSTYGYYRRSPLIWAALRGHVEIVNHLVNHGASVNERDEFGDTALSLAVNEGKCEVTELLLQNGADVNIQDKYHRTPLIVAAVHGHVQVVEFLINLVTSINARDIYGHTALSLAASEGKYEVIELLLQKGAEVNVTGKYNRTPLIWAAMHGHVETVELLINYGASVNARDIFGDTAYSLADQHKYDSDVKKLLITHGAHKGV